jgi:hypothetical protein
MATKKQVEAARRKGRSKMGKRDLIRALRGAG